MMTTFTMAHTIPAGQEAYECQLVTMPNMQTSVTEITHTFTSGTHHLILYTTNLTSIPAGQDQVQDCSNDAGLASDESTPLYSGQVPTGSETIPGGFGLPMTANQVLMLQVHFLNATAASIDASVDVNLKLNKGI